ncbi:MAG: 50S ribosomal protein L40e [Candidatus Diapherotrites archaeon]
MARFEQADSRLYSNVWICMRCNAKNRATPGKRPSKCRKCNSKKLRLKRKAVKKV